MTVLFLIALGYCLAILFPVPWLSQFILNGWRKILGLATPVIDRVNSNTNNNKPS